MSYFVLFKGVLILLLFYSRSFCLIIIIIGFMALEQSVYCSVLVNNEIFILCFHTIHVSDFMFSKKNNETARLSHLDVFQ